MVVCCFNTRSHEVTSAQQRAHGDLVCKVWRLVNCRTLSRSQVSKPGAIMRVLSILCMLMTGAAAQEQHSRPGRSASMQRIMPPESTCADLDWEPVSYCRLDLRGAVLEVWRGTYGPGATLSFDRVGEVGISLMAILRKHFRLEGIDGAKLDQCIRDSKAQAIRPGVALHCHVIQFGESLSLEIHPEPIDHPAESPG